jgi:hypothetical protein
LREIVDRSARDELTTNNEKFEIFSIMSFLNTEMWAPKQGGGTAHSFVPSSKYDNEDPLMQYFEHQIKELRTELRRISGVTLQNTERAIATIDDYEQNFLEMLEIDASGIVSTGWGAIANGTEALSSLADVGLDVATAVSVNWVAGMQIKDQALDLIPELGPLIGAVSDLSDAIPIGMEDVATVVDVGGKLLSSVTHGITAAVEGINTIKGTMEMIQDVSHHFDTSSLRDGGYATLSTLTKTISQIQHDGERADMDYIDTQAPSPQISVFLRALPLTASAGLAGFFTKNGVTKALAAKFLGTLKVLPVHAIISVEFYPTATTFTRYVFSVGDGKKILNLAKQFFQGKLKVSLKSLCFNQAFYYGEEHHGTMDRRSGVFTTTARFKLDGTAISSSAINMKQAKLLERSRAHVTSHEMKQYLKNLLSHERDRAYNYCVLTHNCQHTSVMIKNFARKKSMRYKREIFYDDGGMNVIELHTAEDRRKMLLADLNETGAHGTGHPEMLKYNSHLIKQTGGVHQPWAGLGVIPIGDGISISTRRGSGHTTTRHIGEILDSMSTRLDAIVPGLNTALSETIPHVWDTLEMIPSEFAKAEAEVQGAWDTVKHTGEKVIDSVGNEIHHFVDHPIDTVVESIESFF